MPVTILAVQARTVTGIVCIKEKWMDIECTSVYENKKIDRDRTARINCHWHIPRKGEVDDTECT